MTLAVLPQTESFLLPEDRALAAIERCAFELERVVEIPDVLRIAAQADALEAVARKIKASERVQKAATLLRVEAERQLGRITLQTAPAPRGGAAVPGQTTKYGAAARQGIHKFRVQIAEKLARTSDEAISDAYDASKSKSLSGVTRQLGFRSEERSRIRSSDVREMQKVAHDAIGLLITCQCEERVPRAEEVSPLREAFKRHDSF